MIFFLNINLDKWIGNFYEESFADVMKWLKNKFKSTLL